jgi:hypothetical protein
MYALAGLAWFVGRRVTGRRSPYMDEHTYEDLNRLANEAMRETRGNRRKATVILHRKTRLPQRTITTLLTLH